MKPPLLAALSFFLLLPLLGGCVTSEVRTSSRRLLPPESRAANAPLDRHDVSAQLQLHSLGTIDYDDDALPLISPDGAFLAVRVGAPPSDAFAHGRHRTATPPLAALNIHDLTHDARLLHSVPGPFLLGRGVTNEGFLIEEPRTDGTRRIGLVSWADGGIEWLVDDEFVNAFADINDEGILVFARRAVDEMPFHLVIQRHGEATVIPCEWERSWIDPVLAADGRTVFALRLGDGTLELGWMRLRETREFDPAFNMHPLSDRVNARIAHSVLGAQTGREASPPGDQPCLLFRHPGLGRLVAWTPHDDLVRPFPKGVIAASMLDQNRAVASLGNSIALVEFPEGPGEAPITLKLVDELAIPRRSGSGTDSILLIRPRSGQYDLLRLDLLDVR